MYGKQAKISVPSIMFYSSRELLVPFDIYMYLYTKQRLSFELQTIVSLSKRCAFEDDQMAMKKKRLANGPHMLQQRQIEYTIDHDLQRSSSHRKISDNLKNRQILKNFILYHSSIFCNGFRRFKSISFKIKSKKYVIHYSIFKVSTNVFYSKTLRNSSAFIDFLNEQILVL